MMTTIRRQAASSLYGLAPLLADMLHGKLDQLELMEASDNDSDGDLRFVDQVRPDIEAVLAQAEACLMKIPAFVRNKSHRSAF